MLKRLAVGVLLGFGLGFSASLTDLLNSVQNQITDYEQQGLAIEQPYTYTVLKKYYRYGKLFASYGLLQPANDLLSLASCAVAPVNCNPHKYFLQNMPINYYYFYKKKVPIALANLETDYNAYAEWWIKAYVDNDQTYREYENLAGILRSNFLKSFETFMSAVSKPVPFFIANNLRPNDFFLLRTLTSLYYDGKIKQIVFCGDRGNFIYLIQKGLLPRNTVYKNPPTMRNCDKVSLIWIY